MKIKNKNITRIIHTLACCVFADVSKGWPYSHNLSIFCLLYFSILFWHNVPYKTQMKLICSPLQQSVKTSLKIEVTHL